MNTVASADGREWTAEEWAVEHAPLLTYGSAWDFALRRFGATVEEAQRLMEIRRENIGRKSSPTEIPRSGESAPSGIRTREPSPTETPAEQDFPPIDPVCLFHGKRKSEHVCLYCCLCFRTLTPEECWEDESGDKWDVCRECKADEPDWKPW